MGIKFTTKIPDKVRVSQNIGSNADNNLNPSTPNVEYCHRVSVAVGTDGHVTPQEIILGNYGDTNITKLTINLNALRSTRTQKYDLSLYDHLLLIKNNNNIETYDCEYDAARNEAYLEIPDTITSSLKPGTYKLIYALQEKDKASAGNQHLEQFISDEFSGVIGETNWDNIKNIDLTTIAPDDDVLGFLAKPSIDISLQRNSNYLIQSPSDFLGNKGDKYIKRITWRDPVFNAWNLDKVYVVFSNAHLTALSCLTAVPTHPNLWTAWIPEEITKYAEQCNVYIVGTSGKNPIDPLYRRWISNSLQFDVKNNFLGGPWNSMSAEGIVDENGYFIKDKNNNYIQLEDITNGESKTY